MATADGEPRYEPHKNEFLGVTTVFRCRYSLLLMIVLLWTSAFHAQQATERDDSGTSAAGAGNGDEQPQIDAKETVVR
jgi:hypothetical protein